MDHEATELAAQAMTTRVDAVSTSFAKSRTLLLVIIALVVLSLILSLVSIVRG